MRITVNPTDFIIAANIGLRRAITNILGHVGRNGGTSHATDPWFDQDIVGAVAEFIVAQELNLFWSPKVGDLSRGDVGKGLVEVRCRNPRSGDEIGLHRGSPSNKPYVGVLYHGRFDFEITGWVWGRGGLERGVWNEGRKCFFVPRPYKELDELKAVLPPQVRIHLQPGADVDAIEKILREANNGNATRT